MPAKVAVNARAGLKRAAHFAMLAPSRKASGTAMGRPLIAALYILAMIAVIVGADIAFFRNRFWERLMANVGLVLVFGALYLRFLRHP